jgi:tetratricopeptide (TPR) repeat protein
MRQAWHDNRPMVTKPISAEHALADAIAMYNAGRPADAESACRQALATQPQHPALCQLLALLCLERGNAIEAREHVGCSLASRPDHLPSLLIAARAAQAIGAFGVARGLVERAVRLAPEAAEPALLWGTSLLGSGNAADASEWLSRVVQRHPSHAAAWYELGRAQRELGESADAAEAFKRAVTLQPSLAPAWFALSLVQQDLRDLEEARDALQRVLQLRPDDVEASINLGLVYQELGDTDAALRHYARAHAQRPQSFGRIANALCSERAGRLWLDLDQLKRELESISAVTRA